MSRSIEWTDETWNPVRGCSRVSAGCDNCYAMAQAHRFHGPGQPYEGLTVLRPGKGVDWAGMARLVPEMLEKPMRWRKPRRIFVNSMSDLFHHSLTNEEIAAVFGVMAACPQHTFQVLTKRPERAREWFRWLDAHGTLLRSLHDARQLECSVYAQKLIPGAEWTVAEPDGWPLPNVWLGTSVEDQYTANRRIPELLQCPAALHWVSAEPLLGPLDLTRLTWMVSEKHDGPEEPEHINALTGDMRDGEDMFKVLHKEQYPALGWVVVGGESGNKARAFVLEWLVQVLAHCLGAGVPVFVKQLGALAVTADMENGKPIGVRVNLQHSKGGDPSEWPESLRVRELPRGWEQCEGAA